MLQEIIKALKDNGIKVGETLNPNSVVVYVSSIDDIPATFGRWQVKSVITIGLMGHSHLKLLELREKVTKILKKHFVNEEGYHFRVNDNDIRIGRIFIPLLDEDITA